MLFDRASQLKEKRPCEMEHILMMDADNGLSEPLAEYLTLEGFQVDLAPDGAAGIAMARNRKYSLIIVDLTLPEGGTDSSVVQDIRSQTDTPIFAVSTGADVNARIAGLESGADDYLQKPFSSRELVARIRAVLRRARLSEEQGPLLRTPKRLRVGDIEMDTGLRMVLCAGKKISLTSVEFGILEVLLRSAGQPVPRKELVPATLGHSFFPYDRSIDVHVSKLRKKLGCAVSGIERIKTIRGEGYLYALACAPGADSAT
jgi:DNA-binding response OmpR family regulator